MDKVRARQSSSIEQFLSCLEPLLKGKSLLQALTTDVKMVVSEAKAQSYCNKTIRQWLKDNNYIDKVDVSYASYVYTPIDDKLKRDINTYREAPENRQILRFFSNHSSIPEIEPGMYVTVSGVDRRRDVLDLILPNGITVSWDSVSSSKNSDDYSFSIYEESSISLSVGDVIRIRENLSDIGLVNGQLVEVVLVQSNIIHLQDISGTKYILDLLDSVNRHFEYEYCSMLFEKQPDIYDVSVGCFEKDMKDKTTSKLFKTLKSRTNNVMYAFTFNPSLRKSVQLSCPSDIYSMLKSLIADKKSDMRTYIEALIDKFLSGKGQRYSDPSNNYWFLLYASPGDSKPYALWISSSHYDRITEYCKGKDLRTNRLIFTIVILELVNEKRITIN